MAATEEKQNHWKGNNNIPCPRIRRKVAYSPYSIPMNISERGGQSK
jgi:hypothetical protein